MSQKKSKWVELGTLIKNTTTRDGAPIDVKDQKTYLKLSEEVYTVLRAAGLNVGKSGVLVNPVDEVENLIKAGVISEDKIEERRQKAKDVSSWLKYKVQLPPPRAPQE